MTHAIQKSITDPSSWVPTGLWVPETVTLHRGGTAAVTWLGYYSQAAFEGGAQPANAGVYPRPTTQISGLPPAGADVFGWACEQAVAATGSSNPMDPGGANQFAGGEVVRLGDPG